MAKEKKIKILLIEDDSFLVEMYTTKFELEGFPSEGESEHLMPQTNAEDGLASHQFFHILNHIMQRLRISRAVRKKNPVRVEAQDILSTG